jgi:hypothetical protein
MVRLTSVSSQEAVLAGTVDAIATELGALARRTYGARRRLGVAATDVANELETSVRAVETVLAARASNRETRDSNALDEAIAMTIDHARTGLPPALAAATERVFV